MFLYDIVFGRCFFFLHNWQLYKIIRLIGTKHGRFLLLSVIKHSSKWIVIKRCNFQCETTLDGLILTANKREKCIQKPFRFIYIHFESQPKERKKNIADTDDNKKAPIESESKQKKNAFSIHKLFPLSFDVPLLRIEIPSMPHHCGSLCHCFYNIHQIVAMSSDSMLQWYQTLLCSLSHRCLSIDKSQFFLVISSVRLANSEKKKNEIVFRKQKFFLSNWKIITMNYLLCVV